MLGYRRDLTASTLRRTDRLSADDRPDHRGRGQPVLLRRAPRRRGRRPRARRAHVRRLLRRGARTASASSPRRSARAASTGCVIVPCSDRPELPAARARSGTALVFVDRPPRFIDADAVVTDNAGGARAARRAPARGRPPPDRASSATGRRSSPPPSAAAATARRSPAAGIGRGPGARARRARRQRRRASRRGARAAARRRAADGAVRGQNLITIGAIRALRERGRQHEVALVGFDDVMLADMVEPGHHGRRAGSVRARPARRPSCSSRGWTASTGEPPAASCCRRELVPRGSGRDRAGRSAGMSAATTAPSSSPARR